MMIAGIANLMARQCFEHIQPAVGLGRTGVIAGQVEIADQSFIGQEFVERFDVVKTFWLIAM